MLVFFEKSVFEEINSGRTYYNLTDIIHSANFSTFFCAFTI